MSDMPICNLTATGALRWVVLEATHQVHHAGLAFKIVLFRSETI